MLLRGAELIDGTGAPRRRAELRVEGGRVLQEGPSLVPGRGEDVVDLGGLVLCPGFIDTHSHSDLRVIVEPDLPMKVRQGITLDVLGQDGISVAPVRQEDRVQIRRQLAGLLGDPEVPRDWTTVAGYLDVLDRGAALNLAYLVPHGAVRACAMGLEDRGPSTAELERMIAILRQAMMEGALGLSTGLIYPPCCYAETAELVALCREVARLGGMFVVHMRSESDYILDSIDEMIAVARGSGVHVHLSHFKIAGRENWGLVDRMLDKVAAAQAEGLRFTADQYPYTAGSTMFGAILPPWAHAGGVEATLERLGAAEERRKMRSELLASGPQGWDNFWKWTGPEGIVLSDIPSGRRPEIVGLSVAQAAARTGAEPLEFAFDLLLEERMGVAMISHSQGEAVVDRILQLPYVNVCTDGLLGGKPHPRAFGSFPRLLGRYVRERQLLTLEECVRKMTSQAASAMHLPDRGRVAVGLPADLVAFDAATVIDAATFADPIRFSPGIEWVFTAGTAVVARGEPTGARPGRSVRRSAPVTGP